MKPFSSWACKVLFVSKRLAVVDPAARPVARSAPDARNKPVFRDCHAVPD